MNDDLIRMNELSHHIKFSNGEVATLTLYTLDQTLPYDTNHTMMHNKYVLHTHTDAKWNTAQTSFTWSVYNQIIVKKIEYISFFSFFFSLSTVLDVKSERWIHLIWKKKKKKLTHQWSHICSSYLNLLQLVHQKSFSFTLL